MLHTLMNAIASTLANVPAEPTCEEAPNIFSLGSFQGLARNYWFELCVPEKRDRQHVECATTQQSVDRVVPAFVLLQSVLLGLTRAVVREEPENSLAYLDCQLKEASMHSLYSC